MKTKAENRAEFERIAALIGKDGPSVLAEAAADVAIDEESPIRTVSRYFCRATIDLDEDGTASCSKRRDHLDAHRDDKAEADWTDADHYDGPGRN
jgi:hypothetical protein